MWVHVGNREKVDSPREDYALESIRIIDEEAKRFIEITDPIDPVGIARIRQLLIQLEILSISLRNLIETQNQSEAFLETTPASAYSDFILSRPDSLLSPKVHFDFKKREYAEAESESKTARMKHEIRQFLEERDRFLAARDKEMLEDSELPELNPEAKHWIQSGIDVKSRDKEAGEKKT